MTPSPDTTRPNGAPAYYLGRPASVWISATRRRDAPVGGSQATRWQTQGAGLTVHRAGPLNAATPLPVLAARAAKDLASAPAEDVIAWAVEAFGERLCIASSMTDAVIIHLAAAVNPGIDVIFLDTDYHFPETIGARDEVAATYPVKVITISPSRTVAEQDAELGPRLYRRNPDLCCYLRKVVPLERALDSYDAWISGVRREETDARSDTLVVEWDATRAMVKVNPIAGWTQDQVDAYVAEHGVTCTPVQPANLSPAKP
jgi:phosphoadenosine phosphosulfate reductase